MSNSISNIVLTLVNLLRPLIKWEFDWDGERLTLYTKSQVVEGESGVEVNTSISFNEDTVQVKLREVYYSWEVRQNGKTYYVPECPTHITMEYKVGEGWSVPPVGWGIGNDNTNRAHELRVLIVEVTKNHNQNWSLN